MNKRIAILAGLIITVLIACTTVPVTSMPALLKIDPVTTEIATARVILKYPSVMSYEKEKVTIVASYEHAGVKHEVTAPMQVGSSDSSDVQMAKNLTEDSYTVEVLRVPIGKVAEFEKLRTEALALRENGEVAPGGFGFTYAGGCLTQSTDEKLIAQVFIKTSETGKYVHTLRNVDLREQAQKEGAEKLLVCE